MQLVTRLLLRLLVVGAAMMMVAMVLTLAAAKRNIADEADSSQRIGQLMAILSALQEGAPVARQTEAIDAMNAGDTLRNFHVALIDDDGRRLTRPPHGDDEAGAHLPNWLQRWLLSDQTMSTYTLGIVRPDGQKLAIALESAPQAESGEAVTTTLLQLGLFGAITLALIAVLWISVRHALAPLSGILQGIARIEAGDYAARIAASSTRELNQIAQALNHLSEALNEQIAKQRELLHRLQEVQEEERRRLAHELHDEFGQLLTALQVDASFMLKQSAGQPALEACAQAMHENSGSILSQLRGLLAQLRPYGLQGDEEHHIALEQALRDLVKQRQARGDAALDCRLSVSLGDAVVPQRLAVAVYRIAQEALTNVMRHAQASTVDMRLTVDDVNAELVLKVEDDGVGLSALPDRGSAAEGLGLTGIRERVLANQGRLQLSSGDARGLRLEARFPLAMQGK
jgi:two-component system sensor histidine kinase UhpB